MKELMLEDPSSILTSSPIRCALKIQNVCISVFDWNDMIPCCIRIIGHALSERTPKNGNLRMNTSSTVSKAYFYIAVTGVRYNRL